MKWRMWLELFGALLWALLSELLRWLTGRQPTTGTERRVPWDSWEVENDGD